MALCLVLRNVNKIGGFPSILRSNSICVKKNSSFSQIQNRIAFNCNAIGSRVAIPSSKISVAYMSSGNDHRLLWTLERAVSVGLAGIVPLAIACPNQVLDNICTVLVVFHLHWGLEACCEEYIRPIIFGPAIPKIAIVAVYLITALTMGGMLYFNYTDIGVGKAIRKFWAIK